MFVKRVLSASGAPEYDLKDFDWEVETGEGWVNDKLTDTYTVDLFYRGNPEAEEAEHIGSTVFYNPREKADFSPSDSKYTELVNFFNKAKPDFAKEELDFESLGYDIRDEYPDSYFM